MSTRLRILIIEDSKGDALLLLRHLREGGIEPDHERVETPAQLAAALAKPGWDIVLSDYRLPMFTGMDALKLVREKDADLPFILVSGAVGEEAAIEVMRQGANDFLIKGSLSRLVPAITREVRKAADRRAQRQTEEALADEATWRRALIENALDGIVAIDPDGKVFDANQRFCEMLAYSQEEMSELHIWDWDTQWPKEHLLGMISSGEAFRPIFETRHRRKDGTCLDVEISSSRAAFKGRRMTLCICRDISGRKRAEAALHESEERFRSLVENSPDSIFVQREGRFVFVNTSMLRLFGASKPQDILGSEIWARIAPEYHETIRQRIRRQRETGEPAPLFELEYLRLDGSRIPGESSAFPVRLQGQDAIVVFVRDITERKRMEAEAVQSQRIESLGILAGGIAHDFNNILTGLIGNLSLMHEDLPKDADALEELVDEAEKAAQGAAGLARQLLTFAKGGAPVKKAVDLRRLLNEATRFILRGSGTACESVLPEGLWPVEADPGQLEQVVHNVVLNAMQAMSGAGVVRISAANLELPEGPFVEVKVADSGTGIPEKDLAHIFEPYFTTKAKGRGLGLSIVYSIIKKHGGSVAVESKLGQGTVFKILLPACSGRPGTSTTESAFRRPGSRVLIMDDEQMVTQVLVRMFKRLGCECAVVPDGEAALCAYAEAEAAGQHFTLVIMDLTVPGKMGGKEAVRRLKEKHPGARVAVSSGYANDPVLANFSDYGFDAALPKPYRIEEVAKLLP
jgi:PAS domain S-box-containing protein